MNHPKVEIAWQSHGTRLFAFESGQGQPVVFLHGGLADHRAAAFRVGSLAETHRLITPDLRGSGRSVYAGDLSWELWADDVASLLDHLGIERAVVGGTSMGSGVALRFASRHSNRLSSLILMAPLFPGADRPLPEAARLAMQTMNEAAQGGIAGILPLFEGLPPPTREVALEMVRGFDAASVAATTRFLASGAQPLGSARELSTIDVPVLVVPGTDPQHPVEMAQLYLQHLRRAQVAERDLPSELCAFCDRDHVV